jgi:phosphoglycerate dehydrogenase-like enzyme
MNARRIVTLIPDANYRSMITPETDALLDTLGNVRRATGDRQAVAQQAPDLLREAEVALTGWGTPALQEAWLEQAPALKLIGHCAGSVRGIIPPGVFGRGVALVHAAPIIADAVAEFCVALELLWLRRIPEISRDLKATGDWGAMKRLGLEGRLLAAQTVGLVGSGYVAQRHIRLLRAFGPRIRVADPFLTAERARELGVERASMEEVFGESAVIAVHVPKTPETHHLIGADLLRRIQPGAVLIQTSRSWVMDQEALLRELATGRFFAALDVFDREPQPADSPFYQFDNVIVTPHIAGGTRESYARQGRAMAEEIERFGRGEPLRYQIPADRFDQMA